MRQYDALIGVAGRTVDPGRQGAGGRRRPKDLFVGRGGAVMGEHDRFEQRVGSQAVGAMQARTGDFADGEQAGQGRLTLQVGRDAAAEVMGGGHDGHRLGGEVEARLTAGLVDVREAFGEVSLGDLRGVEQNVGHAILLHHGIDRAGDDIAGREVAERMEVLHEGPQGEVAQDRAFAAHGFRDQGTTTVRRFQGRRMELDHLHVTDFGARAVGHRDTVAGGDVGIGRELIDLAGAARRQHHRRGGEGFDASCLRVKHVQAKHPIFGGADRAESQLGAGDQIDREVVLQHLDLGRAGDRAEQRRFDGSAGHVARVENATLRMAAFATKVRTSVDSVFKLHPPGDEFGDPGRARFDDVTDRRQVAKAVPGGERVLDVAGEVIGLVGHAGDTALGPIRVRLGTGLLRDDRDSMSAFGQVERETQPSDAAADDDCLEMSRH